MCAIWPVAHTGFTTEHFCLVVDDEPAIRTYLRDILRIANIQGLEAEDVAQALQILQTDAKYIDLVITEIQMAGDMDGLDLAYSLRRSRPNLAVLLISGFSDRVPPGFAFIPKPFQPQDILAVINRLLQPGV